MKKIDHINEKWVVTENPEADIWKALLHFSFPRNIKASLGSISDDVVNSVSGSILQANAYFRSAREAPLDISPLLTYYGAINLVSAACTFLDKKIPPIKNHGATLSLPESFSRLGEIEIVLYGSQGGIQTFANIFCPNENLANGSKWTLSELFGSVPDLKNDFDACYPDLMPFVIPVEIVKQREWSYERIRKEDLQRLPEQFDWNSIRDFKKSYLQPQSNNDHIILNRKINFLPCGVHSISGRKFLEIEHRKPTGSYAPGVVVSEIMGLYALGYLSRYRPEIWTPFVRNSAPGRHLLQTLPRDLRKLSQETC